MNQSEILRTEDAFIVSSKVASVTSPLDRLIYRERVRVSPPKAIKSGTQSLHNI